ANERDLIGIGYWAVPYAASRSTFWGEIEKALTTSSTVAVNAPASYEVYPNPATDRLFLNLPIADEYKVYNMLGEEMLTGSLTYGQRSIDTRTLPSGQYSIHFRKLNASVRFAVIR